MRIVTLGGGPAGLYFSLLMKRANPSHEITVLERNPPDATFGWGVVFSDETLGALRDADRATYDEIADTFARWSAIDVRYRGETVRSRGHRFSAIARKRLLNILQQRCAGLGVELRFETDVADPTSLDADLVAAADGVHSLTRELRGAVFKPSLDVHRTKYVWFGTDLVFKAFTFVFRETEHGLFQVHGYPFDARTSTFIVETPEAVWRGAGLDDASEEETIAFCERLFAEELRGHRLLSNRSAWTSFVTVKSETWHDGNVVLLGDAAHTAHFTIGSGTKLAMEDAIALAEALQRRDGDVSAALVDYEMERQPVIERFQQAALESSHYFENVRRYARFEPIQFAFNLLTRSGRITHLELERRDAEFVARVDGWFGGRSPAASVAVAPPPLFAPLPLRGAELANRVAVTIVGDDDATDGLPAASVGQPLRDAAESGAGLALTEFVAVSAEGRLTPGTPGLYRDDHRDAWIEALEKARGRGATLFAVRLGHAGPRGATRSRHDGVGRSLPDGGWPVIAASPIAHSPRSPVPRAVVAGDVDRLLENFARATERATVASFDVLELDMAHGSLLATFLSPLTNRREDEYGGSIEDRARFPLAVLDAVRAVWPADRPLLVAYSVTDWRPGGLPLRDSLAFATMLRPHGADLIHVQAGQTTWRSRPEYGRMFLVPYSDVVRNEAGVPTMVGGAITTRDEVNTILAAGRADLCVLRSM
jgi:anthraniloyl-CoA monooxygenase